MSQRFRPSVTVAAVVARQGRYLLVEEKGEDGLFLNQPAGHLEPGESLIEAVVREAREETAHVFTPEGLLGTYLCRSRNLQNEWHTYLRFAFVGTVDATLVGMPLDEGIVRALWLTAEEIHATRQRHRSPLVWQCVKDHADGRKLSPLEVIYTDPSALGVNA